MSEIKLDNADKYPDLDNLGNKVYEHSELGQILINQSLPSDILENLSSILNSFLIDRGDYVGHGSEATVHSKELFGIRFYFREINNSGLALPPFMLHRALQVLNNNGIEAVIPIVSTKDYSVHYNGKDYVNLLNHINGDAKVAESVQPEMKRLSQEASKILKINTRLVGSVPFEIDLYWSVAYPISGKQLKYDNYLINPTNNQLKIIDPIRRKERNFLQKWLGGSK